MPEPAELLLPPDAVIMRLRPFEPAAMLKKAELGRQIMLDDPNIPDEDAVPNLSVWAAVQIAGESVEETCARLVEAAQIAGMVSDQVPKVRACKHEAAVAAGWVLIKEGYPGEPAEHYGLAPLGNVVDDDAVGRLAEVLEPRTWT